VDDVVDAEHAAEVFILVGEAERLWSSCTAALRTAIPEAAWRTCFEGVEPVDYDGHLLRVSVPSSLAKERIEGRYLGHVRQALAASGAADVELELEIRPGVAVTDELFTSDGHASPAAAPPARSVGAGPGPDRRPRPPAPQLNPRYSFDAFVTGTSNRFAHAAALSVAETPARSYNPLFIYGRAGLGKTHLLHAIAHYVHENYPAYHVTYVTTEAFMNDFVDAIRTNTTTAFKRRYRESDVLLVDDIQFLENKEGLQEEFFHTFNQLHGANRQIVISSDRQPDSIATLEDRLRSRFLWGLITDIQPPELETRLAILRKKAERETTPVPDEVLELIATHVKDNIRELEGALIRVTAYASLNRQALSAEMAGDVLADVIADRTPRQVTPAAILATTATMF
jgi:chromosomal replication initiator protein